jgi:DNA polymerase III subunit delta'
VGSIWDGVVGQPRAVIQLAHSAGDPVHAYLLVGPAGSTKREAARAFAALLLTGHDDPTDRDSRLALAGEHPDVHEIERVGASISVEQAREVIRQATLAPVEGTRKVLILHEYHLLDPPAAAILLKTLEEPSASTHILVLADHVPPELITIASRCVRIDFQAVPHAAIVDRLVGEGVDPAVASEAAHLSRGDLPRARLLATDPQLEIRRRLFADVPARLDGTGATVMRIVDELTAAIEAAAAPLVERHSAEVAELDLRTKAAGERGSGRKSLEDRHKRELRRHRTDELRSGLAELAVTYRDAAVAGRGPRPDALVEAVTEIHRSLEALERNPNEALLLQSLLWSLPTVTPG